MDQSSDNWSVVVTSAPRKGESTLKRCIDSLVCAGWEDPVVFAEPGTNVPDGVSAVHNDVRRGCYYNWLFSAKWALENTNASQILCVQDDALFHQDSRQFSEDYCLWPSENTAFVSLYTPSHYSLQKHRKKRGSKAPPVVTERSVGINRVITSCLWGTLAVIWKREVLEQIVNSPEANNWLGLHPKKQPDEDESVRDGRVKSHFDARRNDRSLVNNSDYFAGSAVNRMKMEMYFVDPSPVQHISKVSTINHGGNKGKRNCGRCAVHTKSLKEQVNITEAVISKRLPRVIVPSKSSSDPPRLKIMIRTSYSDRDASEYRWKISKNTLLKSLEIQSDKNFDIELICDSADHLKNEKVSAYSRIAKTTVAECDWFNKPHDSSWKRIARIDDDDIVSVDFVKLINATPFDETECILVFPVGSFFDGDRCYKWDYPQNQFFTLQTNTSLNPYHFPHVQYRNRIPAVHISKEIHWLWIRHPGALSGTRPGMITERYKTEPIETDSSLFPHFNEDEAKSSSHLNSPAPFLRNVRRRFGKFDVTVKNITSSDYSDDLTVLASMYNTDKGFSFRGHSLQYTLIYNRLFSPIRETVTSVLEFGIGEGASLKMWADYFPNAKIDGLDKRRVKVSHPRVATHIFKYHSRQLDQSLRYDIIIDDADHLSSHQRAGFTLHSGLVKSGGYYVIEDLCAHRMHPKYANESPTMLETCREWVEDPPEGWECMLYGDQLCVLKRL